MTRKNYAFIPVLAAIVLIPQLLFWWLAPTDASAWLAVYIGGSVLTAGIPLAGCLVCRCRGVRRTAGLMIVFGAAEAVAVIVCVLLLAADASVRSTMFALVLMTLAFLIPIVPMTAAAMRSESRGVAELDLRGQRDAVEAEPPARRRAAETAPSPKPLPPRNR